MSQINICPKCGLVFKNANDQHKCSDCKIPTVYSGYSENDWYNLPRQTREQIKDSIRQAGVIESKKEEQEYNQNKKDLILSSCATVDGYQAVKQCGLVFGECVFKSGFLKRLTASFDNIADLISFGDKELSGSTKLIAAAREYALNKMVEEALQRGANAIIGIDSESSLGGDVIHITIFGTAVKLEKKESSSEDKG